MVGIGAAFRRAASARATVARRSFCSTPPPPRNMSEGEMRLNERVSEVEQAMNRQREAIKVEHSKLREMLRDALKTFSYRTGEASAAVKETSRQSVWFMTSAVVIMLGTVYLAQPNKTASLACLEATKAAAQSAQAAAQSAAAAAAAANASVKAVEKRLQDGKK